jgi:hypothetical protein
VTRRHTNPAAAALYTFRRDIQSGHSWSSFADAHGGQDPGEIPRGPNFTPPDPNSRRSRLKREAARKAAQP